MTDAQDHLGAAKPQDATLEEIASSIHHGAATDAGENVAVTFDADPSAAGPIAANGSRGDASAFEELIDHGDGPAITSETDETKRSTRPDDLEAVVAPSHPSTHDAASIVASSAKPREASPDTTKEDLFGDDDEPVDSAKSDASDRSATGGDASADAFSPQASADVGVADQPAPVSLDLAASAPSDPVVQARAAAPPNPSAQAQTSAQISIVEGPSLDLDKAQTPRAFGNAQALLAALNEELQVQTSAPRDSAEAQSLVLEGKADSGPNNHLDAAGSADHGDGLASAGSATEPPATSGVAAADQQVTGDLPDTTDTPATLAAQADVKAAEDAVVRMEPASAAHIASEASLQEPASSMDAPSVVPAVASASEALPKSTPEPAVIESPSTKAVEPSAEKEPEVTSKADVPTSEVARQAASAEMKSEVTPKADAATSEVASQAAVAEQSKWVDEPDSRPAGPQPQPVVTTAPVASVSATGTHAKPTAGAMSNLQASTSSLSAATEKVATPPEAKKEADEKTAMSSEDERLHAQIAILLKINKELLRLCVDVQNNRAGSQPLAADLGARLQSNLSFLAFCAEKSMQGQSAATLVKPVLPRLDLIQPQGPIETSGLPKLYMQLQSLFQSELAAQQKSEVAKGKKRAAPEAENEANKRPATMGSTFAQGYTPAQTAVMNAQFQAQQQQQPQSAPPANSAQNPGVSASPSSSLPQNVGAQMPSQAPQAQALQQQAAPGPTPQQAQSLINMFGPNAVNNYNMLQAHLRGTPQAFLTYMEQHVPTFRSLPLQQQLTQMTAMQNTAVQRQRQAQLAQAQKRTMTESPPPSHSPYGTPTNAPQGVPFPGSPSNMPTSYSPSPRLGSTAASQNQDGPWPSTPSQNVVALHRPGSASSMHSQPGMNPRTRNASSASMHSELGHPSAINSPMRNTMSPAPISAAASPGPNQFGQPLSADAPMPNASGFVPPNAAMAAALQQSRANQTQAGFPASYANGINPAAFQSNFSPQAPAGSPPQQMHMQQQQHLQQQQQQPPSHQQQQQQQFGFNLQQLQQPGGVNAIMQGLQPGTPGSQFVNPFAAAGSPMNQTPGWQQ